MALRIGCDRYLERLDCQQPFGQFGGIGIAFGVCGELLPLHGRIAPQRHDVPHPRIPIFEGDLRNLVAAGADAGEMGRSEEHTSELQSLMRISYAVFCLKKKKNTKRQKTESTYNTKTTRMKIEQLHTQADA